MKNYAKIALSALLVSSLLFLTACSDNWARLKNASTIAIVGLSASSNLSEFDESGNDKASGENVGIGEASNVFGGFMKGNAEGAAKDAVAKRDENLKQTQKNAASFQAEILPLLKGALQKGRFDVKAYDTLDSIDLSQGDLAKGLIKEANTDVIVSCSNTIGYVKADKNFGLSKEYRLAVKAVATFADKDGVIGTKIYFVISGQRRDSESAVPAFSKDEFDSVKSQLISQSRTDLISIKVK